MALWEWLNGKKTAAGAVFMMVGTLYQVYEGNASLCEGLTKISGELAANPAQLGGVVVAAIGLLHKLVKVGK